MKKIMEDSKGFVTLILGPKLALYLNILFSSIVLYHCHPCFSVLEYSCEYNSFDRFLPIFLKDATVLIMV